MGKGGGGVKVKTGPLEEEQASFLRQQKAVGAPIQSSIMSAASGPAQEAFRTDLSAPERQTIERQFGRAREQVLNTGVRGGLMTKMLGDVALNRADSVANAINQAKQLGISRALGVIGPWATPGMGMFGAGQGLASGEQGRMSQNASIKAANDAAKGQGMGSLLGAGVTAAASMF